MHTRCVVCSFFDPLDWELRSAAIATVLLERYRSCLPELAPTARGDQFVDCIPDLLDIGLKNRGVLNRIFAHARLG